MVSWTAIVCLTIKNQGSGLISPETIRAFPSKVMDGKTVYFKRFFKAKSLNICIASAGTRTYARQPNTFTSFIAESSISKTLFYLVFSFLSNN